MRPTPLSGTPDNASAPRCAKMPFATEAAATRNLVEIEAVLARLERERDGAMLSWMLRHEAEGDRMTREEIAANTRLMLSGGLQEPRDVIALTMWAVLGYMLAVHGHRGVRFGDGLGGPKRYDWCVAADGSRPVLAVTIAMIE